MDEETKEPEESQEDMTARVAALREELRNGRRGSRETTDTVSQDTGHSDTTARTSLKVLRGKGERTEPEPGYGNGTNRSTQEKPVRVGSANRRSGENNGSVESVVPGTTRRTAGRLVTDEPIQERFEERAEPEKRYREDYKRGNRKVNGKIQRAYILLSDTTQAITHEDWLALPTSRKQEQREQTKAAREESRDAKPERAGRGFFGVGKTGTVLSKAESNALREPLIAALKDNFKYLDQALWWYSKDGDQPQIWSNMDDEERETVAVFFLKRGERSPAAANFVRNTVDSNEYISTAVIMVPRSIQTMQQLAKRPRQPRQKRAKR
jgi:hypothetical protein